MSILSELFAHKRLEVELQQRIRPLSYLRKEAEDAPAALDFTGALLHRPAPALIAEVKRASPSKGRLVENFEPIRLAGAYVANGASAISILTDREYFQGGLNDLTDVRRQYPSIPILRKDFIYHPYQVYEARAAGADALLLIVAGLDAARLADLYILVNGLGMSALVEVHSLPELEAAQSISPRLVGINNRDLHTFQTDLETTFKLMPYVPMGIGVVSESGIQTAEDVWRLARAGVAAILVGEALITAPDPAAKARELASFSPFDYATSQNNIGGHDG